jgi:hypothetical protein
MNLGELIFQLGFQSTGKGEVKEFNSAIELSQTVAENLAATMEKMSIILEKMALKMGAITKEEIKKFNAVAKTQKLEKGSLETNVKMNKEKEKQSSLFGVISQKMTAYFGKLNAARIAILAVTGASTYFVKKMSDAAVQLDKISSLTGMSTMGLQRVGAMAEQTGASIDDLAGAVAGFQKNSVDIMLGRGGNIGAFQFMGIDPHQDPMKILDQLSKKLKTMPTALGTTMAKDMGLSDDLIYFLKNADNLKPPNEETLLTDKEIKRLKDFNFYFNRIFAQGQRTLQKFAALIMPIVNGISYAFDRITSMFSGLMNKIAKLDPFFEGIKKFLPVLLILGGILFAAFFPLTAAILGIVAAFEDLWSFIIGDDSMLGRMLKRFTDINDVVKTIIDGMAAIANMATFGIFEKQILGAANAAEGGILDFVTKPSTVPANAMQNAFLGGYQQPNVNQNINIQIDGSKNPVVTGQEVKKEVSDAFYGTYKGKRY